MLVRRGGEVIPAELFVWEGTPVLVIAGGCLSTRQAANMGIVEATAKERAALLTGGYCLQEAVRPGERTPNPEPPGAGR